ncbi:hypothetical protein JOB18_039941 [Solea senegalensis]|uniref:Uncharacterized protein n=1 Tax=Solea senegalensis TaxID=28829 RepID=A0AAV6T1C1_SOLSE|nr:uncharacterized protein si:ch211-106e7.2 [Solea senegalensis]KAG7523127.1 hypothetical protein JOB18_039941 [Solea senegalensis]
MEFQKANSLQDEDFWMSCFQISAVPNSARYRENNHLLKTILSKKFICAPQNPAQNSRADIPTNLSFQPKQGPYNQPTHPVQTHHGSASSGVQYQRVQEPFYQNLNASQSKSYPTATSPSREQMFCSRTFVSPTAHHQQTGNIQNYRRNVTQQSFSPVLPSYNEVLSQPYTTRSAANRHILCNSSVSLQNQQYVSHQLNSAPHRGGEANYSVNSNSYTRCYVPNSVQKETNTQHLKETAGAPQKRYDYHDENAIARIENYLYESYPTSSPPTGRQYRSEDKMMSKQMVQPTTLNFAGRSNSNPTTPVQYVHMSTAQHMKNTVPQKRAVPRVTQTGQNGAQNHIISKADFGSDASQSMQLHPHRAVTLSTGVNNQNDGSTHSSPGCVSMRAVAVVQPLSQESPQVGNNLQLDESTATDKSLIHGENVISPAVAKKAEYFNGYNRHLQSSNQKLPDIQHSAASNDGSVVSDSAGPQEMSQEQVAGEQCNPSVPQMSITSEVPQTQNWEKNKGETSTDPKACVTDLSSVQTTPWTAAKLANLIQELGKAQVELQDSNVTSLRDKLKALFWKRGNQFYHIISSVINLTYVENFCKKHLTSDTVILSQLKENSLKQLQNYYVLEDGEVYSEPPYISSWLNVNEQLDDIDKEFGFSSSLYDRLHTCSQSDKVGEDSFEMPNKDLFQTELVPADSGEENPDSIVKSTSTCLDEKGSTDSSDSYYSFEIKVLPPEEAKSIFEQLHKASAQSMDIDSQPERVTESSMEDRLPNNEEVTGSELDHGNKDVSSIETFCCLEWWMETIIGSESPVKCNCKKKLSGKACTEKNPNKEEMMVQDDSNLCVIKLDRKGEAQEKAEENGCNQNTTSRCSALSDDLCSRLTGDGEKPQSKPEKGIDDGWSSIGDEDLSSSQSEIPSYNPHSASVVSVPEEACVQELCESAGVGLARNSDCCNQEFKKVFSEQVAVRKKRKKKHSHKFFYPFPKKPKTHRDSEPVLRHVECKKVSADATDEPSDSNVKNAELMLFGSKRQLEIISFGGGTSNVSPPKTLSVNLSKPSRHKSSVATPEYSAKQMVHDTWRRSYLPITMRLNGKLKLMTPASYPQSEVICNTKEPSKRKTKHRPRLKKRQRLAKKVKLVEEDVVPLKQPDQQRSGDDNRSNCSVSPRLVQRMNPTL